MMRYYIGFLVTFGLLILLVFLLFHGGSKKNVPTTSVPLYSYASTGSQARLTIDGTINANEQHEQVQITANQNTVTYDQIQGYDGQVVNQQQFNNSENAYSAFLHALEVSGFTEGNTSSALSDEQGQCPLGNRYIFELIQNGKDLERFWTTNCPKSPRSFEGDAPLTISLFEAQVPEYPILTKNLTAL